MKRPKPTGLAKVSRCVNPDAWFEDNKHLVRKHCMADELCPKCNGTGFIRTDLTAEQAVEVLKNVVRCANGFPETEAVDGLSLPDGSHIELKEKP